MFRSPSLIVGREIAHRFRAIAQGSRVAARPLSLKSGEDGRRSASSALAER
ncbi:hypothetical protein DAPPUDRAFT_233663 [Daphnia pulex]|uniref:Uncharacterized protein n=1 Tax=Daphnia pulex TaxID=6669 RepID=E9FVD8_DAPPU|nr:hypothetical protein DAPPUDRAFT_233663 [Daphnia pulex]|eukprot:EFX88536.1 hypothetical protein DAPPUDRAFT_233663 [Daphnia pulex]